MRKKENKVVLTQQEYINLQVELNNLKYQKMNACDYILNHSVLDRKVIGAMLTIPQNMLEAKNG